MNLIRRSLFPVLLLLLLIAQTAAPSGIAAAQGQNLLTNPGFEGSGSIAPGWAPWHRDENTEVDCTTTPMYVRPEWNVEIVGGQGRELIYEGNSSQQVGNQWRTWNAGVFQTVSENIQPGTRYRMTVYARGRASNNQYPAPSDGINLNVRVGIDPTGQGLWYSSSIVWSDAINPLDNWQQATVEAVASGNRISVYVGANLGGAGNCRAHLDVWFDTASLTAIGPPPTNTPVPVPPTATPVPATATPDLPTPTPAPTGPWFTPTPPPTEVPVVPTSPPVVIIVPPTLPPPPVEPTAETVAPTQPVVAPPTSTPEPALGTICANAFADANANGVRDANEGYMAGIPLLIAQSGAVIGQGLSSGTETPICFDGLQPGTYTIAQRLSTNLEPTTIGSIDLPVEAGQTIGLEFGSRLRSQDSPAEGEATLPAVPVATTVADSAAPTAVPVAPPDSSGTSRLALVGLGVLGAAVVGLSAAVVVLLRRR
jgi:hypothetical protein